ncbi:spore germination protein [Hydrogenibacillus schlegelii]|uniref:spore germination protein n=1 Tax=Hydrogenibacillus schlegelii TaxID=1484 RepID=UPI0014704470|nr:spore germination protein [Hydrogenibacillus schlegelii]
MLAVWRKNPLVTHRDELKRRTEAKKKTQPQTPIPRRLAPAIRRLEATFHFQANDDFRRRELVYGRRAAALFYFRGIADEDQIERAIIRPISLIKDGGRTHDPLRDQRLTALDIVVLETMEAVENALVDGHPVLLIDRLRRAYAFNLDDYPVRNIDKPTNENVLKGPQEGFTERLETNIALLRRYVRSPDLIVRRREIGQKNRTGIVVAYIQSLANPHLVADIESRLDAIEALEYDWVKSVEQLIEERPYSLLPSMLTTERPDRAMAHLMEGHVVILQDNLPYAFIAPATYWNVFHASEDHYQRLPYAWFIRSIRTIAFFLTLLTPGLYIAATNYHVEMIPLDLLMSISGSREVVPFPAVLEVFLMELSFELIREASVRIPSQIGPTIGIVGALILGQAAVQAGLVSPILVIVVAITGLASFTQPDLSLNLALRIGRFAFLVASALLGFLGLSLLLAVTLAYAVSFKSFGVGYYAPWAPYTPSSQDVFLRRPAPEETTLPQALLLRTKTRLDASGFFALFGRLSRRRAEKRTQAEGAGRSGRVGR